MIFTNLLPLTGLLTLALPLIRAQNDSFIPFDVFLQGVQDATYAEWNATAVESSDAFDEIQAHILSMYNGIGDISNTFVLGVEYADCVDIDKQPTVRLLGVDNIQTPPSNTSYPRSKGEGHVSNYAESPLKLNLTDRFGNHISCPEETIPFARLTLQKLTRFPNLRAFFDKPPPAIPTQPSRLNQRELLRRGGEPHLHAEGYEYVKNFGGNSWLNLWNPVGDFSLSQQWYVGGSGAHLQTVEGGWVNYEQKFQTRQSVLFIFYTPDNYSSGCWNMDCPGFVQTNNNWFLGAIWDHYSVSGGEQWGFEMQWKMYQGTWYLFLKGPGNYELVGHYPPGIFGTGQLTKNAELIEYGGEVTRFDPSHKWPQMGSGAFPSAGWTKAAFQKSIFYIPKDENGGVGIWTSLFPFVEGSKKCWDVALTPWQKGGNWGSYLYFGGPGGNVCG
jgi:hypothetical protein